MTVGVVFAYPIALREGVGSKGGPSDGRHRPDRHTPQPHPPPSVPWIGTLRALGADGL
jgi:hypothetical protein